jgi:protein TonB
VTDSVRAISGDAALIEGARETVQQWRYKPIVLNGEPADVVTSVSMN